MSNLAFLAMINLSILITPVGNVDSAVLTFLTHKLPEVFGISVRIGKETPVLASAYNSRRRQYHSTKILTDLDVKQQDQIVAILGVTEVDLFVPGLNFVFGEANPRARVALISLCRLQHSWTGAKVSGEKYLERSLKEAVHELGHVFGLGHCSNPKCVMFFSNSILDTDRKGYRFCEQCRKRLQWK